MKFSRRLCSMLFEIYPEAKRIEFENPDGAVIDTLFDYDGNHFWIDCEPPDDGITEYKRDEVFVYGDDVEFKNYNFGWVKARFICYDGDSVITNRGRNTLDEGIRKPLQRGKK